MEQISISKLFEFYLDTLQKCGMYLINAEDCIIEYNIFEEFDIGVHSFFHCDNLTRLKNAGFINDQVVEKTQALRNMVLKLDGTNKWNIDSVRHLPEWKSILKLSDDIKNMIANKHDNQGTDS